MRSPAVDPDSLMSSTMQTWRTVCEVDAARGTLFTDDQVRAMTDKARLRAADPSLSDKARQVARIRVQCEGSILATLAEFRAEQGSTSAPQA